MPIFMVIVLDDQGQRCCVAMCRNYYDAKKRAESCKGGIEVILDCDARRTPVNANMRG
jgi:hypothetical protein